MSLPAADLSKQPDNRTTMELGAVLPLTAEVKDDHLYVGGVDMVELAREQGTALYVMDEADMRTRMETYLAAFRSRYQNSDVVYASKAFLNKEAARIVADEGLCLDVSGGGELAIALAAGFPTERIFMHGNNKTPTRAARSHPGGRGRIIIDSRIELKRISEIAGELGVVQPIYMRITPGVEADTHQYIRTGCEDSKFGFTMRDDFAYGCVKDVLAAPNVRLAGLHCHIGSQIFALHSYPEAVEVMVELMARIEEGYGYRIEELDVGGGLEGIASHGRRQAGFHRRVRRNGHVGGARGVREVRRARAAPAHRAGPQPGGHGGRDAVHGGHSENAAGHPQVRGGGRRHVRQHPHGAVPRRLRAVIANKAGQPRTEIVTIAGKHCESGDAVVIDMPMQHPDLGDIVAVFGTGAYCYTMASNYNGQPRPAIVFVKDGQARVTTRRETYEDLMSRDI